MTRVRRSDEIAIDDDRRILHPGCTGGFSVGLHDQFGVRRAVIEPRHAAAGNDPRTGGQHRPSADASDDSASSADVSYELGYAWIFGKQGRAFCTTWNEDAHIVLGPRFRYRTLRSEEHTSELQSLRHLVCRLLLEKKKNNLFRSQGEERAQRPPSEEEAACAGGDDVVETADEAYAQVVMDRRPKRRDIRGAVSAPR